MAERIPALSLWRPWPTLILHHGKDIENRGWPTKHRGPVWIHAAKRWDSGGWFVDWGILPEPEHPTGIVGLVQLTDVCNGQRCACSGWAADGQYHWRLANPRPITPVPCNGRQGLWWPTGELAEQLQQAVSHE